MRRSEFLKSCLGIVAGMALSGHRSYAAGAAAGSPMNLPDEAVPHPLTRVSIHDVTIDDTFWSPKIAVWRRTTIHDCFDKFEKTGAVENFDRVAARAAGGHHGDPWWDGLVYEMITAASDFLAAQSDPLLMKRIDGYIERIAAAADADPDGYVNTDVTLGHVGYRWSDPPAPGDQHDDVLPHTLYNAGCLVEAGVHHYRATGKTRLLEIATRMADYMCRIMGPPPRQNIVPGHAIAELAFIELFLLYRSHPELRSRGVTPTADEHQYLDLAEFWIENRGNHTGRVDMKAYDQDDLSVFQQAALEGHAVRAGLLAAGIAQAASVNRQPRYYATARRWWDNMVEAKMYVTGGLGSTADAEGFGADFNLPNPGYLETCAAVAGGDFSRSLNLATGQAKYVDVLERELYNGALSGVSLAGDSYFYTNYLVSSPDRRRWAWHPCPCCPPMFLKLMSAMPGCIYATDSAGVYVNLFVGGRVSINQDGLRLVLRQTTDYPWSGTVRLSVTPPGPSRFAVSLRVPDWCREAVFRINHRLVTPTLAHGYARIERTWRPGDMIEMIMPLHVRRIKADPRVAADVGLVALARGPIVYCFEGLDNGGPVSSLILPPSSTLQAEHRPELLGGVTVLRGTAQILRERLPLGKKEGEREVVPASITAVPFYTNTNRAPTEMMVWVADDAAHAQPLTTAGAAVPSASHCNPSDTIWALNNGKEPSASDDETIPRFTWWDHRGTAEWVQYDFPSVQRLCGVDIYWWDEARGHRDCRVPQSWTVQYRDGSIWRPIAGASVCGTERDTYNRVTFPPLETTALRLAIQLQPGWSGGILQWRVLEARGG